MVGMKGSKNIIAINKDKEAPIFGIADLGIVGDVHKVLPKLIEALQSRGDRATPERLKAVRAAFRRTGLTARRRQIAGGSDERPRVATAAVVHRERCPR